MTTTIEQQVALDEALVPSTQRSPFFKAYLVTTDVPEIYMKEFWATAKVHQHSIRFKLDTRNAQIKTLTDVNVNKLFQPWRSFAAVINKCLTGKSSGIDSLSTKTKGECQKKKDGSALSTTPPTPIATLTPTTTVVAAPKLFAAAKGKQPARAISLTDPSDVERTKAEQLKIVLKRSRQETPISQHGGFSTDEGSDEADKVNDDDDDEEEISKIDEQEATESDEGDDEETKSDGESKEEETREKEQESFDPIPRTPEESEDDGNDRLQDSLQKENDEFLRTIDDNMKKIIKEQVKSQVKAQVTRILPRIKESVNAQLEAKVLTRSSHSSRTSYAVAADLSEMELKKILIDKMEGNKSIQRSDEQRNLYKALVKAYDADKSILDSYGESAILKRRREDDDDQEGPFAGSDWVSKRRRECGEHASASTPSEPATTSTGRSTTGTQSRQLSASAEDQPIVQTSQHPEWFSLPRKPPTPYHTPIDFSNFIMNRLGVDTLTPELLAGPTYEFMRGSYNRGHRVIPFEHFINNDLEYLQGGASSRKYTTSVTKTKAADYGHSKWIEDLFYGFDVNWESSLDVYSKRRIIVVTNLKIVEWHNYKHLDWISVRRDDDKIYKFKEGDFKRLRLQDIKDMLLLLEQGKLSNLTVEKRFAFNVSLRMFTRSIVIQRRVADLQLGVESYQKRLNLTKPDI
nr:hypothetical protein [Tanacetum cinerariifolium]